MTNPRWKTQSKRLQTAALTTIVAFSLSACASSPVQPTRALQAAESAIADAEQARVVDFAAPELKAAREKLIAANSAVLQEDMVLAGYLATESTAEAELALAITAMTKNKAVNEEMQKSINTLKQELDRNSGAQ